MHCRNCGKEVHEKAVACPACGVPPLAEKKFCQNCGAPTDPKQVLCVKCGASLGAGGSGTKSKVVAGVLGILLGSLGIHKFYLGYSKAGAIMLAVSLVGALLTAGVAAWAVGIVGVIEGIIYLTKSDADFERVYVAGRREWF
jgi:TM2 domain-containing membrane protein YozV